ncbi:MAG: methyltransferase, FxLD system [Pseudonocardia sp.]
MNTLHDETAALREAMIDELRALDGIRSDEVAAAFRTVPRHVFAPDETLETVYAPNTSVWAKRDRHGVVTSTVSAAHIQAVMLEQAGLRPGMRVLEIGSGGYNAALIAELVGSNGEVTSVDIDAEILDRARACLDAAGYDQVRTVLADADQSVGEHAPYDRIIVTVRAWDIPPAWTEQLTPDGRIVVPLRMRCLTRSIALDRVPGPGVRLSGDDVRLCSFVPMQGAGAHDERLLAIDGGRIRLRTDSGDDIDVAALADAVRRPRIQLWSGVEFDHVDELDLWLGTWLPEFGILTADQAVVDEGLLTAATRRGVPAAVSRSGFAYRTKRPVAGSGGFETGVLAWGPDADRLGEQYLDIVRRWDRYRRDGGAGPRVDVRPAGEDIGSIGGGRVIDKRHTRIVLSWPRPQGSAASLAPGTTPPG